MLLDATKRIKQYVEEGIEVLIAAGRNNGIIPLLVKMAMGASVKLVYCEHSSVTLYRFYKESPKEKVYRWLFQQMLYHVPDRLVTLTNKELEFYKDCSIKSCSIYNFLDDKMLEYVKPYREDAYKIITVGNMHYAKGYEYLIEVAKRVLTKHPELRQKFSDHA